jgi:hypothetical protein
MMSSFRAKPRGLLDMKEGRKGGLLQPRKCQRIYVGIMGIG